MNSAPQYQKLLRKNIYIQLFFLMIASIILDGGSSLIRFAIASIFYWSYFAYFSINKKVDVSRRSRFFLSWGLLVLTLCFWVFVDFIQFYCVS
jgi:hypothetical protein